MHKRHTVTAVVTGKPIAMGGSRGRREATGRGVMFVVKEALRTLGMPHRMAFTIALAFRLVPLFLSAALSVVAAQGARGLDFTRGNVFQRLGRYMPVIVPVFMGALRRADSMAIALETRGFSRAAERTHYPRSRVRGSDLVAAVVIAAIVGGYVWAWSHGYGRLPRR
jgi:energy-coupling factor transporter transmembrane protein EcfT